MIAPSIETMRFAPFAAMMLSSGCEFRHGAFTAGVGDAAGDTVSDTANPGSDTASADARSPFAEGSDLPITSADASTSKNPSLVYTGTEFAIAWHDQRDGNEEIYFVRLDTAGVRQGSDVRITNQAAASVDASLVWTGSQFGVAWREERDGNREIYFARVNASGVKQGVDVRVTNDAQNSERPSLAWDGTQFAVGWQDERDGNKEIYFARLNAGGVKQASDVRVTTDGQNSEWPSLTWTGTMFAVAWQDERDGNKEIYLARIDATGTKQGTDIRVTSDAGASERPSLVGTGTSLAIAWQDDRDGNKEIYVTRSSNEGIEIGDDVRVTNAAADSQEPSLVWTGTEYGVAWKDNRDGNDEIYCTSRDANGQAIDMDHRTTNDLGGSKEPSFAGAMLTLGIAWTDNRSGNDEIFFQTITP